MEPKIPALNDDTYAYQREELLDLLRKLTKYNEPLVVHGTVRLTSDDAARVLHNVRQQNPFSSRDRAALTEAGFDLSSMFPHL